MLIKPAALFSIWMHIYAGQGQNPTKKGQKTNTQAKMSLTFI